MIETKLTSAQLGKLKASGWILDRFADPVVKGMWTKGKFKLYSLEKTFVLIRKPLGETGRPHLTIKKKRIA